jgi:hypothetical protein
VLGHVAARRQQERCPACGRDGVEMRPPILVRKENDTVGRAPGEVRASVRCWYRANERLG